MGYPMTFQRFVNRNGLAHGGYDDRGDRGVTVNYEHKGLLATEEEFRAVLAPHWQAALKLADSTWKLVLGDLRRLEADATDEGALCGFIAGRTGVDPEVVAIVLKEFVAY